MDDLMLQDLAIKASVALAQQGLLLATAESCTGGWLGQTITSIAGSSTGTTGASLPMLLPPSTKCWG